jgi:phosphate ABC transporter permease protein PstC
VFLFSIVDVCYILMLIFWKINLNFGKNQYFLTAMELAAGKFKLENDIFLAVPVILKFIIYFSFLSIISAMIFIFLNKKREVFLLTAFSFSGPISMFFINRFLSDSKILNSEFIFINAAISALLFSLSLLTLSREYVWKSIFKFSSAFCVIILASIILYVIDSGMSAIFEIGFKSFFLEKKWNPATNNYGILAFILCSVTATIGSAVIGVPIGILTAVFLSEFAPKPIAFFMRTAIRLLAGIPSVVYGFFGMLVIVPFVRRIFGGGTTGDCLLSAILILAVMILPTIISLSEDAIKAVPQAMREAAFALGETKAKAIFKIVLPSAKKGIMASILLGLGKSLGETMAVIMVAGNAINMPSILRSSRFLTTAIALEISYASGFHRRALFACGIVLILLISAINCIFMKFFKNDY